ncbi:MAG: acylphosphatase [Bacteroidales bacterium]|nr:acylphosphatase [Bacteroidales bacterium]
MIKSVSIKVSGRLKQVGYHSNMVIAANELHIAGKYQSNPDGSVSIIAQGEEKNLQDFIEYSKKPSPFTRVDSHSVEAIEVNEEMTSFEG